MTVTGAEVVKRARFYKGKHEDPMGSNRGAFVQECQHATFLGGTGWPWCAAFVCLVCKEVEKPLAYNGAGAHDLADHHLASSPPHNWHPGMVVDFNIGSGHTGILVSHTANTVTTVDGNWSDSVVEHVSAIGLVRKVWRVPGVTYNMSLAPAAPPATPPKWIVTTGKSGHKKVFRHKRGVLRFLQRHIFPHGITIKRGAK